MPGLFRAWKKTSGDPDTEVEGCLETGGSCCILVGPVNVGVFAPVVDAEQPSDPFDILMDQPVLSHTRIDEDDDAFEQIEKYVSKGYVYKFQSVAEAESYVGGKLVLSDLVIIEKQKPDGTVKRRVILNCRSSGVSKSSKKSEKAVLPRVLDLVFDTLEMCVDAVGVDSEDEFSVELWVADIVDAYCNVTIHPS